MSGTTVYLAFCLSICVWIWYTHNQLMYSICLDRGVCAYYVRTYMAEMKAKCTSLFGSKLNPIINVAFLLFTGLTVR